MINFSIPPKPGEVTLDTQKMSDLFSLRGHTQHPETLVAGVGYAIGALLMQSCQTGAEFSSIASELTEQAKQAFEDINNAYAPSWIDPSRFALILQYGIEEGSIITGEVIS